MEFSEREAGIEDLTGLLNALPDLILQMRMDGTILFASPASRSITGLSPRELHGSNISSLFNESDTYLIKEHFQSLLSEVYADPITLTIFCKDKKTKSVEIVSTLLHLKNKETIILSSIREISGRLQSQKELEERYASLEDEVTKRKMMEEYLMHQSGLRNSIIQHSHVGISALDKNMIFQEWNPAMEAMTGIPAKNIINRSWKEIYKDHVDTEIHHQLCRVLEGEKIELKNKPFIYKKGFHNSILLPLHGENNEIIGLLGLTQDISEHKDLNDKLAESESFLKKVTETTPNIISVFDIQLEKIIFANKAFFKIYGLESHQLSEENIYQIFSSIIFPEDISLIRNHIERVSKSSDFEEFEVEYRGLPLSESVRWFITKSVVFKRDADGRVKQILTNTKEITNRKKAEQELIRNRDLLYQAQKAAKLGVWEWDIENNTLFGTEEFKSIFGIDLAGHYDLSAMLDLIHSHDKDMVHEAVTQALLKKENFTVECRISQNDEKEKYLLINGTPKISESGQLKRMIGSVLDITELRDTEALLKKKEEFLSIASHELKTPLTTAKAYIELVKKFTKGNDNLENYVQRTSIHIDKLTRLISDLLDISKIQSGKMQFEIKPFDLDSMLTENIENLQATSTKHLLKLEGQTGVMIHGDKERLGQVISNLVNNAVKYSPQADEVLVTVEKQYNQVLISVKDKGIGIDPESYDKIFDRFFRVNTKRGHFQGLGIGLFISKEIVHRHNGKIWVESIPEKGSTFTFSLPLE